MPRDPNYYESRNLDSLANSGQRPIFATKEQEEQIRQECGRVSVERYHFNFINIGLTVVLIVLAAVLVRRNRHVMSIFVKYLKKHALLTAFIAAAIVLVLRLSVNDLEAKKFFSEFVQSFVYVTDDRKSESELVEYQGCRSTILNKK